MFKSTIKNNQDVGQNKKFIMKQGLSTFIRANVLLMVFILLLFTNFNSWNGFIGMILFVLQAEIFIVLLAFLDCFKLNIRKEQLYPNKKISKNEYMGMGIVFIILLFATFPYTHIGVSFPSGFIMLTLIINLIFSFFSVFLHPLIIGLYKINVYETTGSILSYIFKYFVIFMLGINYHVQVILQKYPIIINKVIAILFVFFLAWQTGTFIMIFDDGAEKTMG